jgi:hypothetical protein
MLDLILVWCVGVPLAALAYSVSRRRRDIRRREKMLRTENSSYGQFSTLMDLIRQIRETVGKSKDEFGYVPPRRPTPPLPAPMPTPPVVQRLTPGRRYRDREGRRIVPFDPALLPNPSTVEGMEALQTMFEGVTVVHKDLPDHELVICPVCRGYSSTHDPVECPACKGVGFITNPL